MADYDNLFSAGGPGSPDYLGGTYVPNSTSAPAPGLSMPNLLPSAGVDVGGVKFRTAQDPAAVKLGPTRDPYRLDMDPFGDKTVKWGKLNGVAVDPNYVLSANVFGKVMSREQLLSSDAGRRLVVLMEEMRNGHRRSFADAMSEWSLSDVPFMSLVGAVGKSAADAVAVSDAFHKWSNGEELTDDEAIKARLYMAEQERAAKGTWGSTVGDIIRAAPGFMLEFAATSGMYSYARAGLAGAAKSSASAAAKLSLSRTIKMGTRDAVERGFAAQLGRAAETTTEATVRAGWQKLGTEAGRATVEAVKQSAVAEMAPIVKASLGVTDDMARKIAASRTETEIARAIARNSSSSGVVRWARGLYLGAKDHVSRALLDFGDYGSELYSVSGKGLGSAMKTLQEAIGILGVEAPVRGAMVMMPQAFVVKPLLAKTGLIGQDGRTVSAAQLSLEASAARTGNKALMSSAESVASALNFLEYASENSGAGFGKLFRAAGLGLFGAKAMGVAAGGTRGLVPGELTEAAGSRLRQWINRAVGTTDEFLKGHMSNKVRAVSHALEKAELPAVSDDVIETFIGAMGSPESMRSFTEAVVRAGGSAEKLASVIGENPAKFVESAVREALRDNAMGMTYRSWARYALANYMARHKFGPEQMTSWLRHAGYDGVVEEMLEERYSDFVKGLFGLDDKSTEFHGFGPLVVGLEKGDVLNNVTKAFSNLNPGWDQLTAEAVGFAVPLGVRVAVHNIQRAAGGSELSRLQAYCDNIREFRGVNNVVEAETGTHVRAAREAVQSLRDQLRRTAADGTSSGLEVDLEALNAKLDAENATPEYRESQTAALREQIEDVNQRIAAAEKRAEQLESVAGSAEYNAERIRSYEALDTSERADSPEFRRRGTPTPEQARRGVTAQETLVQGAAEAGRVLAETRDAASEFGKLPLWRRAIARTTGILGALVTGDISMAQYDPMAWTAEDHGLSSGVVGSLADAYDRHKAAARDALREQYAAEIANGSTTRSTVEPTDAEISGRMKDAYEREARTIMESYLAATGVRIFSRREMEEQARGIVESRYGTLDGHEDEVSKVREDIAYTTLKLISSGAVQSSDARDITRGIINLSDDSPFTDEVVLDAAMRLSGFRGLEETLELRPETDLKEAVHGRSLPAETVKTLAGADLANLTDEQQAEIIKAAKRLGYAPRYNADGSAAMLYTPAAIDAMNHRVIDLCRKALAVANPRLRTYRKAAEADPVYGGAAPEYVQVRQSGDLFTWNENGQRKSVRGEEALAAAMSERGFQRTDTNIVFSLAREIRTKDPAVMLEKLGLTSRYLALAARNGGAEELASGRVHPMFRLRDPKNNVRYTVEEARRLLEYEVGMADRFRSVMNRAIPEEDKKRAFRNSNSETDAKVAERYAEAERLYKFVYGSEQEQNGYLPTIQKLLSAHGVELPGSRRSHTALLTSDLGWYTLNTRNLNFIDGSSYVFVDLSRDVDYDGALMSRAITNGLMANRRLWAYDPEKKAYPAFAGVVRDIVKRLDRVANDLVRGSMALNRDGEADAMRRLSDMLTGGTNLNSPRLSTVTWIIRNAILGQADREAAKSKSTTHLAAASARLAEALRQTPEFYPFLGFADLVLGGDGFATAHKADSGDALKGVARLASVFSGDESFSVRDLVTNSMLPMRDDGTRMSVDDFLKKVNDVTSSISKAKLDGERARKAAEQGPMEFIADIMDQAKLRTAADLRAFMSAVLTAAGVKAGNTCDLANWNRAIEAKRLQEAMREKDIEALAAELADRTQELEALKAETAAGTNARVAELQAQVEELTGELNRLRDAQDSTEVPEEPESEPPGPVEDPDLSTMDQDALDDMDSLGADDFEVADSFDAGPAPDTGASETAFEDPAVPTLSPEGRRYAFRSVVRYLAASADDAALGRAATRDEVMRAASVLFPAMADVDKAEIFNDFSSFQQQVADETKQDEASLLAVREYLEDEKEEHTSDSDGWNDKAVAAYNSLKPMLEVMETAMPTCRRNFQGMLSVMRDEIERLMASVPEEEAKSVYMQALSLANRLISPRTVPTGVEGRDDLAARLAVHRARLDAVFGDSDAARNRLDTLIRELTKKRNGEVRPSAAQLAAFFSFIGSIGSAGARQSVMLFVSSSVARDTVSVDPTWVAQEDMDGTVSTEKTGNTAVSRTSASTGSVSVEAATSAFLPLVGKSGKEVTEILEKYRAAMAELRGRLRPVMFEGAQAHILNTFDHITESDINDPEARDRVVYTGGRVTGMLLQDIECFRNNAQIVAEALGRVLGQDNPLSQMLRAKSLYRLLRQRVLTGSPSAVKDVLNVFEKFGLYKDGMAASQDISSVFEEIARRGSTTRDDVVNIAQTMFSTGDLRKANIAFPGASPNIRDAWLTLLDLFSESLPATVTRSRAVEGRPGRRRQVAVAAPGMIPIIARYIQRDDPGNPMSFWTIAEGLVRADAETEFYAKMAVERGEYVNPKTADAATREKAKQYADARIEELGGREGIVASSLQTMCWPDASATPIVASNLTLDYSPLEVGAACAHTYEGSEEDGTGADRTGVWYTSLFGGDHAANNLVQIPTARVKHEGRVLPYKEAVKLLNKATGVTRMMSDTKRSAITSATAAATPMIGADVEFNGLEENVKAIGECRVHLVLNFGEDNGAEFSQEAMHGQTVAVGPGPEALRAMAKNPKLRISKFHLFGTGEDLAFGKSATSIVSPDALTDGGAYPPGTMPRAFADYVNGFALDGETPDARHRLSADFATDEDSYKVGPLKSQLYQVATAVAPDGTATGAQTILAFIKTLLKEGVAPAAIMSREVRMVDRTKSAKAGDPVKLSDVLPGLLVTKVEGFNSGTAKGDRSFSISFTDNTSLALKVANIAHNSKPHIGSNGKNYTLDMATKAIEQMWERDGTFGSPESTAQNNVFNALTNYATLAAAVATEPEGLLAELESDPRLTQLMNNGADPGGLEYCKLLAETAAKRIRDSVLAPVNKINAVLVSCGATRDKRTGRILDHSASEMRRDIHLGSVVFDDAEVAPGALYEGFRRRLALSEVNNASLGFRYGMFLDVDALAATYKLDSTDDKTVMECVEVVVSAIVAADTEHNRLLQEATKAQRAAGAVKTGINIELTSAAAKATQAERDANSRRRELRRAFMSCFVDHHGENLGKQIVRVRSRGGSSELRYRYDLVSFADLMVGRGDTSKFDRTALLLGQDMVKLDVYDFETGQLDEANSRGKMPFLAGSAFLAPRTPSYNGGMGLQIARASLPDSERKLSDGSYAPGEDGLVALDPQTLDVEGSDNDGDESALASASPEADGAIRVGDMADGVVPAPDTANWQDNGFAASRPDTPEGKKAMLEAALAASPDGVTYIRRRKDGRGFEFTPAGLRAVANQLITELVSMAHDAPVPPGKGRRQFAAAESVGLTKAQPFDDARWWKREKGEEPGFEGHDRLVDFMPPDLFREGDTIGDPDLQNAVTLSAKKSGEARASIVSAASTLHILFMSGCFVEKQVNTVDSRRRQVSRVNRFSLFREDLLKFPAKWRAFIRHFDGLSNATFDDVKERICQRLGLTAETVDILVCDLLSQKTVPTTDEEWFDALKRYVLSVRDRRPDGTQEWRPGMTAAMPEGDKSRLFMAKTADKYPNAWHDLVDATLFAGANGKERRRQAVMRFLGLDVDSEGRLFCSEPVSTGRGILGRRFLTLPNAMSVIAAAAENGGHNDVAGYIMWIAGRSFGNLAAARDNKTSSLSEFEQNLASAWAGFGLYMQRRQAWKSAKDFARAINFSQCDPGAADAARRAADAGKAYADIMRENARNLDPRCMRTIVAMRQAVRTAYSSSLVESATPEGRVVRAFGRIDEIEGGINTDLETAFRGRGDTAVADDMEALDLLVANAHEAGRTVFQGDMEACRDSMTSVPYVVAALQTMPRTGMVKSAEDAEALLRGIASGVAHDGKPSALYLCKGIEALFSVMYASIATSAEGRDHPGITYFGTRTDGSFSSGRSAKAARGRAVKNYGIGSEALHKIFPTFSVRNEASLRRARAALDEVASGWFDGRARTLRYRDTPTRTTFDLTKDNIAAIGSERRGFDFAGFSGNAALATKALAGIAAAMNVPVEQVRIRPSDFMRQLLPVYITMTQPVTGTPTYEQFTNSSLSLMKGLYRRLSRAQAGNDRSFDAVSKMYAPHARTSLNLMDALATLDFSPVCVTDTWAAARAACEAAGVTDRAAVKAKAEQMLADPSGLAQSRRTPENRTLVDIFAYNGALFRAARLYDALGTEAASRRDKAAADAAVVEPLDAMDRPLEKPGETDPRVRTLADGFRQMLAATAGLDVSVEGNTITVSGRITGERALKRRGVSQGYVNTVVRIDVVPGGRVGSLNLESRATALSITHALRTAGVIDISVKDFLEVLDHEERMALVKRFMPEALAGQAGVAMRNPIWSVDGKGLYTLATAVKLRTASEKTAYHEYFHAMMGMLRSLGMLSDADAKNLSKHFGDAKSAAELFDEEKAADAFAEYVGMKRKSAPKNAVTKFFARLLAFIKSVINAMTNNGFSYGTSIKVGDTWVDGKEQLFNVVLSGRAVDSSDSPKSVALDLKAARQVRDATSVAAGERLEGLLRTEDANPPAKTLNGPAQLAHLRLKKLIDGAERFNADFADNLIDTIAAHTGVTRERSAVERGGDTRVPGPMEALSAELANTLGNAIPPGDGFFGDNPEAVRRSQRVGHGITQAIARGLDALDPSVLTMLDANSDLTRITASTEVQRVVFDGVFDAAETLGVDLKSKDQHLKNLVYGNALKAYAEIANNVGRYRGRIKILHAREHKGDFSRTKAYLSRSDVAAWLLTAGGLNYADIARDALGRLAEMRAMRNATPDFVRILDHLALNIRRLVNKRDVKGDPINEIRAGITQGQRNRETGARGLFRENLRAGSAQAIRNRNMYHLADGSLKEFEPLVQEALDISLRTAFTLSAAKKFYDMMGIEPTSLTGDTIPGGLGERVRPRNRRSVSTSDPVAPDHGNPHVVTAFTPDGPVKVVDFDGYSVSFSDADHRYWTDLADGNQYVYTSGTAFIGSFFEQFDAEAQARRMRTNEEDVKELLARWERLRDESAARGTVIHKVYEDMFSKGTTDITAPEGNAKLAALIDGAKERARKIMEKYDVIATELIVASKERGVAGTIDLLARNKATGRLTIIDHKTSKWIGRRGFFHKDTMKEDQMLHGIGLPASRLNSYALQVHLYARLLKENPPKGLPIRADEPVDFAINLYNGLTENEIRAEKSRAQRVYSENPDIVVRSAWLHDEIPDMTDALDKMFEYAKDHPEEVLPPSGVNRGIQPPVPDVEVAEALNLSVEDLLDDRKFIDPFCEVGLYVNNPGEWLASTCRKTFGGRTLRDLFQDEHKRLKGATDVWTRKMNWWARVLGEDKLEGQPLLAVIRDKGHHVFSDGHVAYDETGHDRTGFDNYSVRAFGIGRLRGNTTDVTLDRADKEMVDYWLKSIYFEGMGGTKVLTGVDGVSFTFDDLEHPKHRRWQASDFSRDKVERMYNSSYVRREMPRMYVMLAELLLHNQVPAGVLDDSAEGAGDGLYSRVVSALVDSLNGVRDEYLRSATRIDGGFPPSMAGSMVLKRMAAAGVLVNHADRNGVPTRGAVCIPISDVETAFRRSAAYRKLLDAGRYEVDADGNALKDSGGNVVPLFTRERILKDCMTGYREAVGIAAKSPWMVSGDGRYFNNLGTAMPFFAGPGVFMYNANRIGKDEKKDVSARMNEYEKSFVETLKAEDQAVTDAQISFLHDLFDTGEDAGSALRLAIGNGEYEAGTAKAMRTGLELSPSDLGSSHKVAAKIYARLCEIAWADRGNEALVGRLGGRGSVARMIDIYEQAAGERTSTGGVGLNAEQMYQINGVLPANFQCFHAVSTAIQSLARTCQFRNTFVDFLFTADAEGRPVAYAKPSLTNHGYVDDGIPEEVWEYLARWWANLHGRKYDEGVSGRMNAARLYDEIVTANESKVIGGRHFRALPGDYRAALSSVSDFAAVDDDSSQDNVNARNVLNGGETYGYAKMLFSIPRVVGGKAQSLLLRRVSAYSKTLCVQQSAFFPIATKIESPVGAVGFWTMFMSNFTPQAARNLDKFTQRFDKTFHTTLHDTLNRDFVGFKDVIEMMDTDDPFLADAVRLCDALGISLTDRLVNPYEDGKAIVQQDKQKLVAMLRASGSDAIAKSVDSLLEGLMFRGSERAFSYALNATKIATALQIAQKVRARCAQEGRAFDIEKELKPYAAYINAEVGGIDPMRYAWANPRFRDLMSHVMFSWEWTKGAWVAGGGEVLEDMLLGGHMTNPETRAQLVGRWLRMYGTVMIGVPVFFQVLCKLIGLLLGWDDDDDKWWTWQNEQKIGVTAFDITPLLKGMTRGENALGRAVSTVVGGLKSVPVLGRLVPGYTGKDPYNTTGGRRFYMHFGKQVWEFIRWFTDPVGQAFSKLAMHTQRLLEGVLGYNPASKEYDLPFSKKSQAERWLLPTLDSATVNLVRAFMPFSWNSMVTYGDAGALSILGPVKMGTSYMAAIKEAEARLGAWAVNDRKGYQFGYSSRKNRFRSADVVTDILRGARLNGMDGSIILAEASGLAAKPLYNRLYDLLPKEKDAEVDEAELRKVARGLRKLNIVRSNAVESLKVKFKRHNVQMTPEEKARGNRVLRGVMRDPFAWEEQRPEVHQAGKAGDGKRLMGNFLATDKVPDTIFGIPVVSRREDYTEGDIAFFREHPEAGGYYDLGGDSEETEPPEGPGTQGAEKGGDSPSHLKRNGNLSPLNRKRYLFRDRDGKVEAYGTQDSIVMLDPERGEYVAIPTIVDGRAPMSDKDAFAHYKKTGEFFHRSKDAGEAIRAAHEAHLESADEGRAWWNNYIADHIDDGTLGPELTKMRDDPGFMKWARGEDPDSEMKRVRQDARDGQMAAKGGKTRAVKPGGGSRGAYPGPLNNPGNVEKRRERRPGEINSPHERWAKFATPQDGLREMADVIRQIADVKLAEDGKDFTIRNFAEVYAPRKNRKGAKENDTDKYIRDVSSYSGLDADAPLSRDVDSMAKLLRTVVRFESGYPHSQWFTDDEYRNAAGRLRKTTGR